jgi:PncC family amidohydrolase
MLSKRLGALLKRRAWTLSVAESSTAGLLGHLITQVSGSSAYFMGGVIAYDNAVKCDLLNVRQQSIQRWGAVSAQVALEMALGAQRCLETEIALSITGIAGPTGATPQKPVGLAYIGLAAPAERWVWRYLAHGDRDANNHAFAEAALAYVVLYLGASQA